MMPNVETWMFYTGDGKKDSDNIACLTVSARAIKVVPVSQYIELRDTEDKPFVTITWPSTIHARKVGV